ncbi:MAG: HAMP domain-containing histidine kinase [Clostridiales bacterium]|jgi:signal transduction histidine kinase|nr:HAMP domain-containing histidine kinase [Clostridiales bacterium]
MSGIRRKMVISFMFIILITVIILEIFFITGIRSNYYNNLEETLFNQLETSKDIYIRYFSDSTLQENIINNVDTFWKQTSAQVEIIDQNGNVLMNSHGTLTDYKADDLLKALEGEKSSWIGNVPYDRDRVMAASYPLVVDDKQIGVLRFIASLSEVNKEIRIITYKYLFFGAIVVLFTGLVSLILARTITEPMKRITSVAEEMAKGNFNVKSDESTKDEVGKLSDTLNYLAAEIMKKDELKNNFISSVSHELRTPLTSIKGWAVTLMHGYEDKELLQDGLNIIEKESDRLSDMVSELLDFSRFVTGNISLQNEKTDIGDLIDHIRIQLSQRALALGINFKVEHNFEDTIIYTDPNRLKQVFINLLDNAFKFTPSGGRVTLKAINDEDNFYFYVEDTGCGISEEDLPRIKEKFYKGKSSKSQTGLGLSISDEIIKLMGGTIEIKSELDKGTQLKVSLPIREAE